MEREPEKESWRKSSEKFEKTTESSKIRDRRRRGISKRSCSRLKVSNFKILEPSKKGGKKAKK